MSWLSHLTASGQPALSDGINTLSYAALIEQCQLRAQWLTQLQAKRVALLMDNGIEWVLFDLACAELGITCIPIPLFFSPQQRQHTLQTAGVDSVISDSTQPATPSPFKGIYYANYDTQAGELPLHTQKITFTSGSTGTPKGVCLSQQNQQLTANALAQAIAIKQPAHLCLLPLATLLENIAGVYTPLLCGGTVYLPSTQTLGFCGSQLAQPEQLLGTISRFQPNTVILVPELLQLLVRAAEGGWAVPRCLTFIAVGGARVSEPLLSKAQALGLPVFQGYGLSECSSVVALNRAGDNVAGSIGKPLPHIQVSFDNGELQVHGNSFLGYLEDRNSWYPEYVKTGDLITADKQGRLWFSGRRRNQIISSLGRNISPEWPEAELLSDGLLTQAVVLGDDKAHCIAIVAAAKPLAEMNWRSWLAHTNAKLPDYAQVKQCLLLDRAMNSQHRLMTANGRPNREAISQFFHREIEALYQSSETIMRAITLEV